MTTHIPIRHIQATHKEPALSEGFNIRDVKNLLAGQDMTQPLHRHDFFYILALEKGQGTHEIDFVSYEVGNYCVFLIRPGQVHQLTLKAGSTGHLVAFTIDFYTRYNKVSCQLLHKAGSSNHYQPDATGFHKLHSLLSYIFREYTYRQAAYQEVIIAYLGVFFIELSRQQGQISTTNINPYAQERLAVFLSLVETHIASHKQVSQYADMLHLSLYQLNAITKATLGKTGSVVINEHIILESKRQLLATTNQVSQIAAQLGYEDLSYFIRFFKKHTGYSPEAFRQHFN